MSLTVVPVGKLILIRFLLVCATLQNDSMKPKLKPKYRRKGFDYYQNNLHILSFCNSLLSAHRHAAVLLRALCRCTLCHHCTEKITNFLRSLFTTNPCCDKAIKGITDTVRVRYSSNNGRNEVIAKLRKEYLIMIMNFEVP